MLAAATAISFVLQAMYLQRRDLDTCIQSRIMSPGLSHVVLSHISFLCMDVYHVCLAGSAMDNQDSWDVHRHSLALRFIHLQKQICCCIKKIGRTDKKNIVTHLNPFSIKGVGTQLKLKKKLRSCGGTYVYCLW